MSPGAPIWPVALGSIASIRTYVQPRATAHHACSLKWLSPVTSFVLRIRLLGHTDSMSMGGTLLVGEGPGVDILQRTRPCPSTSLLVFPCLGVSWCIGSEIAVLVEGTFQTPRISICGWR